MATPQHLPLAPSADEVSEARRAYERAWGDETDTGGEDDNSRMIQGRAEFHALCRQYPEVAPLLGNLQLDAPEGFGTIEVGLPNDPKYTYVVLHAEDFLELALAGEIALNQQGYPDYTGTELLRGWRWSRVP